MSKKMMLLALAVVSAAAFALPAGASAAELHASNAPYTFGGTFGAGTLTAEGEPVITCGDATNINHVTGNVTTGGTTGHIVLDFTGCHTSVFGFTAKCRTANSPLDNTIASKGVFHFITVSPNVPGVLVTADPTEIICAGISNTKVTGNIIGTITSPKCGAPAQTSMTLSFTSTGNVQNDKTYTSGSYNLSAQTSGGTAKEAGLNSAAATVESATASSLTCT